jgi:hypothetical protein
MSIRGLTLTHDRLEWNFTLMVSDAIVFGNTGNSVEAETGSILGAQSGPPSMRVIGNFSPTIGLRHCQHPRFH